MTDHSSVRLILLPALGADDRLFGPQKLAFPGLIVPPWIVPKRRERLPEYAARMAETIEPGRPMILGGVSFGGAVAYEMARYLRPDAVVLIGSCRSAKALPRLIRGLRPIVPWVPVQAFDMPRLVSPVGLAVMTPLNRQQQTRWRAMLETMDAGFMKWVCRAMLAWRPTGPPPVPVRQIHGAKDPIMPVRLAQPDEIVPGAGHLLNLTHPQQVNAFLLRVIEAAVPRPFHHPMPSTAPVRT